MVHWEEVIYNMIFDRKTFTISITEQDYMRVYEYTYLSNNNNIRNWTGMIVRWCSSVIQLAHARRALCIIYDEIVPDYV